MPDSLSTTALPPPAADYADWLPPMLVKELRQGLRSRVYVVVFVLLQAVMLVVTGIRLANEGSSSREIDVPLWLAVSGWFLLVMPARGLSAISDEDKAGTLDLVQLTHLGSFQIVLNKWLALVGQALLLLIAVLPYVTLRYFFGGVDVVREFLLTGLMFCFSLPLTAFAMALSTAPRAVRFLAFLPVSGYVTMFTAASVVESSFFLRLSPPEVCSWVFASGAGTAFALAVTAQRISAPAENASARMRLIALLTMLLSIIGRWASGVPGAWMLAAMPIALWAALEAMSETTCELPVLYVTWVRRGVVGRLAGRLLYPGWASGLIFVVFLIAGFVLHSWRIWHLFEKGLLESGNLVFEMFNFGLLGMTMVFPAVLLSVLPRLPHRRWAYLGMQAFGGVCLFIACNVYDRTDYPAIVALTPLSAFVWSTWSGIAYMSAGWLILTSSINSLCLLFLILRSRKEFRKIRLMERQAASLCHVG